MESDVSSTILKTDTGMKVSGKLIFTNITDFLNQGNQCIEQNSGSDQVHSFEINCQEIQRLDSAGIALLLEWQRKCSEAKKRCSFSELSTQAQSLIKAYRLESVITA